MWTRKELKEQAREALQRNYWRIVLVSLILLLLGNCSNLGSASSSAAGSMSTVTVEETTVTDVEADMIKDTIGNSHSVIDIAMTAISTLTTAADQEMEKMDETDILITGIILFAVFVIIVLGVMAVSITFITFLFNPFSVGAQRFMLKSIDGRAEVKEIAYAFDHSYKNVVKVMFCMEISIFLWSLLLIIPGFYKKYQYRMVEYIIAEHPDMHYKDAMQLSKDMMDGEKWHAFLLDLSFILWEMAGVMTCGIAYVLFVSPYQYLTNAALYRKLCALRYKQYTGSEERQTENRPGVIDMTR